jgi:hypothetical protein
MGFQKKSTRKCPPTLTTWWYRSSILSKWSISSRHRRACQRVLWHSCIKSYTKITALSRREMNISWARTGKYLATEKRFIKSSSKIVAKCRDLFLRAVLHAVLRAIKFQRDVSYNDTKNVSNSSKHGMLGFTMKYNNLINFTTCWLRARGV